MKSWTDHKLIKSAIRINENFIFIMCWCLMIMGHRVMTEVDGLTNSYTAFPVLAIAGVLKATKYQMEKRPPN